MIGQLHPVEHQTGQGVAAYGRKLWAITVKELRTEFRTKEVLGAVASFSVLAVLIFGLAFDLRVPDAKMVVPGVLWAVVLFAGVLALTRSFGREMEHNTLSALLLAPMGRSTIFFGKVLANFVLLLATQLLVLPTILVIYDVNLFRLWIVVGLILGVLGYTLVGSIFAALTASLRSRETLLPIMMLPVMVPLFIAGVGLTAAVLDGRVFADFRHWLGLLAGYDLLFIVLSFLLFDLIWSEAL